MLVLPSPATLLDTCHPVPGQLPFLLVCGFLSCPAPFLTVEFTEAPSWAPASSLFGHLSSRSLSLIEWMDFMHKKLHWLLLPGSCEKPCGDPPLVLARVAFLQRSLSAVCNLSVLAA